ncbi:hypothetical protein M0R45_034164 [Rubus argutus]|uniref:PHD-type domain-containing protein n=1 Tax=Rubus argutus TaxID=59490 RepID=A0AAW1VTI1_RUBAR
MKGSVSEIQVLCKHCAKLKKLKQYCGICKKIWHHSDGGDWVCCDGCNVWVHAECDKISSKFFKDLEHIDYYCPDCKKKSKCEQKGRHVTVVCNGMEGTYVQNLHMVVCQCGFCGYVKVKATMLPLKQWIAEHNEHGDKQRLLGSLQEKYEPVNAKWTSERCAICRWVDDWEDNKMIICNRCQIAVHQECYGAKDVQDFTSWVCRACETPDVIRECCLCPVKGGALKPTDVDTLWNLLWNPSNSTHYFFEALCNLYADSWFLHHMLQMCHAFSCNLCIKSGLQHGVALFREERETKNNEVYIAPCTGPQIQMLL